MKRRAALVALSREHHPALALAKRIATATKEHQVELCAGLGALIARELEPHFATEEADLLPRLLAAGADRLVTRTIEEHRMLRERAALAAAGDLTALVVFGCALHDHVRFEERELFPAAEACLDPVWLDRCGPDV